MCFKVLEIVAWIGICLYKCFYGTFVEWSICYLIFNVLFLTLVILDKNK
jgi:hypothetical protein